jgi:hypothetical protein
MKIMLERAFPTAPDPIELPSRLQALRKANKVPTRTEAVAKQIRSILIDEGNRGRTKMSSVAISDKLPDDISKDLRLEAFKAVEKNAPPGWAKVSRSWVLTA